MNLTRSGSWLFMENNPPLPIWGGGEMSGVTGLNKWTCWDLTSSATDIVYVTEESYGREVDVDWGLYSIVDTKNTDWTKLIWLEESKIQIIF